MIADERGEAKIINKEVLWFVKWIFHKLLNGTKLKFMLSALCNCVVCMSSVYGTIGYLLLSTNINIIHLCATVLAVAGLNRLLISTIQR
jgi:hypothetical protein